MHHAPAPRSLCPSGFLAGLLALAACGPAPEDPAPAARAAALHENQGTGLLATTRASYSVNYSGARDASGVPFSSTAVRRGALEVVRGGTRYSGASSVLVGARFLGADGTEAEITRACPHPRTPPGWKPPPGWTPPVGCSYPTSWVVQPDEYEYEITVIDRGVRQPLCSGGWNRAVPMTGTWDAAGGHATSSALFSFACNGGVAVKCSNWGYKPWEDGDRHQACTRLGRADYCGDGTAHTFEGTPIDVYDPDGINLPVTSPSLFEAAWGTKGALCLSKLRWQTLPPDGYCASVLPDPRTTTGAHFCDDLSQDELLRLGAKIYNNSGEYERGLNNWLRGSDRMLTSAGAYGGITATTPPEPGYTQLQFEGIASRVYLTGTAPLRTYRDPLTGDSLTTLSAPPARYTLLLSEEGYAYPPGAPLPATAVPLSRYSLGSDQLTTTLAPPAGYTLVRLEGYLPVRP